MRTRPLLVILTAVIMGTLTPSAALAATVKLAVMEFAHTGGDADWAPLGKGFQEMMLVDLSKAEAVDVVERRAVRDQQLALGVALPGSSEDLRKLGSQAGATHVLSGAFNVEGKALKLTARLLDVASGKVVMSRETKGDAEAFFEVEQEVVQASIGALEVNLSARERAETGRLHTADFLAFQDFSRGLDDFDAERYEASLQSLRRAAERDTQFSLAAITLEQYTELIASIREKADAVEVVRAEQQRLDKLEEANEETRVLKKLLELANLSGDAHVRERMTALHTLAIAYGNEGRARNKLASTRELEDRFAMQRASDEFWIRYQREARTLWPALPIQPEDRFYGGFPTLENFDAEFEKSVKKLWELGADYPENRINYLSMNLRYPRNSGGRMHLSMAEQVRLHDTFLELAPKLPVPDHYYKYEYDELIKSYRTVLRFDDSTRILERRARESDNEHALRGIASQIEDNKEYVEVMKAARNSRLMSEWMMIAAEDGWSKGPILTQAKEHFLGRQPDAEGIELLTRMRDWPSADNAFIRINEVPVWCHQHCYWVWTGPRSDARVSGSVRFYRHPGKRPEDQDALLFLDSAPRADLDASFTVRWNIPSDFGPRELDKGAPGAPLGFMVGLVDLDVKKFRDPVSREETLTRPMHGYELRLERDTVSLVQVTESERTSYDRKTLQDEVLTSKTVRGGIDEGSRVDVAVRGRKVFVTVNGQSVLQHTLKTAPVGFTGLRAHGDGFVEVADLRLSGAGG